MYEENYGLNYPVKSFAIANEFVLSTNKICYKLGNTLRPFCFFGNSVQAENNVPDLINLAGLEDEEKTVFAEILAYRVLEYKRMGTYLGVLTDDLAKAIMIDYLLSVSICYLEIPTYVTKNGVPQKTFEKILATKNPIIMGMWMGKTRDEMQAKYSSRAITTAVDFANGDARFAKLRTDKKGNSITIPRTSYSTKEMSCTPLFALHAWLKGIEPHLKSSIVNFHYMKDNNTIRELPTTLSSDILYDYYKNTELVANMLNNAPLFDSEQGNLQYNSKTARGYIRLPEVGGSMYDATGVRALNLARITKVEILAEVSRTYINVDLDSVIPSFYNSIDFMITKNQSGLITVIDALNDKEHLIYTEGESSLVLADKIKSYIGLRSTILTTQYNKFMHDFMCARPELFPYYTGRPFKSSDVTDSKSFGIEEAPDWLTASGNESIPIWQE